MEKEMTTGQKLSYPMRPFINMQGSAKDVDKLMDGHAASIDREIAKAAEPYLEIINQLADMGINSQMPISIHKFNLLVQKCHKLKYPTA